MSKVMTRERAEALKPGDLLDTQRWNNTEPPSRRLAPVVEVKGVRKPASCDLNVMVSVGPVGGSAYTYQVFDPKANAERWWSAAWFELINPVVEEPVVPDPAGRDVEVRT